MNRHRESSILHLWPKDFSIVGTSTSNVRVECHHGRNTKYSLVMCKNLESSIKTLLNPCDPLHKFILCHVYSGRKQDYLNVSSKMCPIV
jgi:hypothetical protein